MKLINITEYISFGGKTFPLILGPCVIESRDHTMRMAEAIKKITDKLALPFIFKSSYDKANRTSVSSFRGPGIDEGLQILADVNSKLNIPIITDIHLPDQATAIADVADIIQIPAFLCRQTDLLIAAGDTGKPVNVKKGQFLPPLKVKNIVEKIESTGNKQILITERGNSFGFDNLIVDMRSIPIMQDDTGYPVIFDGTHSAQMPGNAGNSTGGLRKYIPTMVNAAVAAGCNGLFMEVHDDVENAKSDSATQWPLDQLENLLIQIKHLRETVVESG
ncbi:MAG: 3-deoxy-8-phosphooctulonate synthase [Candidatus Marinimicrobia bacterium]|nr:3-deoxy-8-phosphooctulonate synthase [Candidatus Neomarinimicrobiota bacterium]